MSSTVETAEAAQAELDLGIQQQDTCLHQQSDGLCGLCGQEIIYTFPDPRDEFLSDMNWERRNIGRMLLCARCNG